VVVDDIPQSFQAAAFSALVDVSQVEVLRGPQNTLFGKSASAGVVNITTGAPTSTFTARTAVMFTDDNEQRYQAMLSGPIGSSLKYRLAANYSDYRGSVHDLTNGAWLNGEQDATLRGKLEWTPAEAWSLTLSPWFINTPSSCCAGAQYFISPGVTFGKNLIPQSVILNGINVGPNNTDARYDVVARGDGRDYGSGLKIAHDMPWATLALISSYDWYHLRDLQDTDSSDFNFQTVAPLAPPGGSANGGYFTVSSTTQELRLTSTDAGRFRYVTGLYYSNTASKRQFVRGSNDLGTYGTLSSLPSTNSTAYASYLAHAWSETYAAFGQSTLALTNRLDLTTGLRFNHEQDRYNFVDQGHSVVYGAPDCSTSSPTLPIRTCNTDNSVTGRGSLDYHLTPDHMVFAGYARGFKGTAYDLTSTLTVRTPLKSGPLTGIPTADAVAAKQPIPAETVDSYEFGFKNSFFNHRLTWNVTAFDEEFRGFQAQSRDQLTNQNVLNSIGKVTTRGVETELATLVGNFNLSAGGAYDSAVMNSFPNANCYTAQTVAQGCINGQQNLSGKPLFNAPKWNLSVNGEYDSLMRWHDTSLFVSGGVRWQSMVVYNLLQDPDSVQPAYALVNAAIGVQNSRWKLTFFGNNLLDKRYALTIGRSAVYNISQTAVPPTDAITWTPARDSFRYFGVRVEANFGG
jgi:iron complex outermembrane receptor protein